LVHRKHESRWLEVAERIGEEQAQRFWDHVALTPGSKADGVRLEPLKGSAGKAKDGWSKVLHWRVPGSPARFDYRYRDDFEGGAIGDPHLVVRIEAISYGSH
jgi:hypothetical protein